MDSGGYYDEFPDYYSTVGGIWSATPPGEGMTKTLSPRQAAQNAVNYYLKKKPPTSDFDGGKWVTLEEYGVSVIEPPCGSFYVCYHTESIRLFRSVTKKSSAITPSTLRAIVDPIRPWLLKLFVGEIPGGKELLALERGDTSALDRRNETARRKKQQADEERAAQELKDRAERTAKAALPTPHSPPARKSHSMALIDVETTTKRIILETRTHSILLDRTRFLGLLKSAGAEIPKTAELAVVYDDGSVTELFGPGEGDTKIRIEWKISAETEEGD